MSEEIVRIEIHTRRNEVIDSIKNLGISGLEQSNGATGDILLLLTAPASVALITGIFRVLVENEKRIGRAEITYKNGHWKITGFSPREIKELLVEAQLVGYLKDDE